MNHRLLTTQDLADRLGISSSVLREWRKQGKGPCFVRIGHMIRYTVQEVELFERQFKSRSDWVVAQLAPEPEKLSGRAIKGRLRRPGLSEQRTEAIIKAYLEHLFCHEEITDPARALEDYVRLMALKITRRDPTDGQIEIEIDNELLTAEVLFVDLVNTLGKLERLTKVGSDRSQLCQEAGDAMSFWELSSWPSRFFPMSFGRPLSRCCRSIHRHPRVDAPG